MTKLEPAAPLFPQGGALKAVAKKRQEEAAARKELIEVQTKIKRAKAKTPLERRKADLEAQAAHIDLNKPTTKSTKTIIKKKAQPAMLSTKPLKGME